MMNANLRSSRQSRTLKHQEQLAQEHRELLAHLREVVTPHTVVELAPLLQQLYADLLRHFTHEQAPGGFYSNLEAFNAQYGPETRKLVDDHRQILSELHRLIDQSHSHDPERLKELSGGIAALAKHIRNHERKEDRFAKRMLDR
jgi:hypothetical protein